MPITVESVDLYAIYDSVGGQTLEARVNGGIASCPAGISKSAYEAAVVPVSQALKAFERVKKELIGTFSQPSFDSKLAKLMPKLGTQATTALSLAFYDNEHILTGATSIVNLSGNDFPNLLGNVLGGGAHSPFKTKMSIQEILVLPKAKSLPTAIETNFRIWREVGQSLASSNCGLNHESAWTARISDEVALGIVAKIARRYRANLGIDVAASQLFKKGAYVWSDKVLDRDAHIARILKYAKKYRLVYIEDPMHQDDFPGFAEILRKLKNALVCGDDLIATNLERLKRATRERAINAVIIKPNQAGTVSASISVIRHAEKNKIVPIVSHRSRETQDTSLCKLAQLCPIAKLGVAGIRTVKLNGLLRLWHAAAKPKMAALAV